MHIIIYKMAETEDTSDSKSKFIKTSASSVIFHYFFAVAWIINGIVKNLRQQSSRILLF